MDILLKATGDAPIMKTKKWTVEADRTIASISQFVKKYLKLAPTDNLVSFACIHENPIENGQVTVGLRAV